MYGLKIEEIYGAVLLRPNKSNNSTYFSMDKIFRTRLTEKLENDESTKEDYDAWRYKYPELDTPQICAKVPPQKIKDLLLVRLEKCKRRNKTKKHKKTLPIFGCHL